MSIAFPNIDPVLVNIGPLPIRWYSLAYIAGITIGIWYVKHLAKKSHLRLPKDFFDNFLLYTILGIILGGRLGYVFIYNPNRYLSNPMDILRTWDGGMSFHGGLVGFLIATIIFAKKHRIRPWKLLDLAACAAPIGIFFGRIANFINGELFGRITDSPLGMVFPMGGPLPRHPSQIYEALTEGLLLFLMLNILFSWNRLFTKERALSGMFCILYSTFRFLVEFFREPDSSIGYILTYFTMGQVVSAVLFIVGIILIQTNSKKYT